MRKFQQIDGLHDVLLMRVQLQTHLPRGHPWPGVTEDALVAQQRMSGTDSHLKRCPWE